MLTYDLIHPNYIPHIHNFVCNDEPSVELFLKQDALRLQQNSFATTRLYFDENDHLVGFFTLFNDQIQVKRKMKTKYNWTKLEKGCDYYPAVRLHFIGVDSNYRNKSYGTYLLIEILAVCDELRELSGCNFLSLEALPDSVAFYEKSALDFKQIDTKYGDIHVGGGIERVLLTTMIYKCN